MTKFPEITPEYLRNLVEVFLDAPGEPNWRQLQIYLFSNGATPKQAFEIMNSIREEY